MGRKARRQPRGCQRGASKSKVQSSKPSQAIPPWPFDGLSTLDIWAMHLTPARGAERGCGRRPSRSAWQMRKTSEPLHALRLVLRTQPRSDRPTCVKCIALIHNDQFSIPGILPLAVTLGLAAFISLTGALALIVVWSAMTAVMRHEDLHSAKTAIVRQIRYPDLDVVNPSRA